MMCIQKEDVDMVMQSGGVSAVILIDARQTSIMIVFGKLSTTVLFLCSKPTIMISVEFADNFINRTAPISSEMSCGSQRTGRLPRESTREKFSKDKPQYSF